MIVNKIKNESLEWIKAILIAIALTFIIRLFFFTPIVVDGASMEPTLYDQERMIVTKIGEPKRFDIIVFHATENEDYIKRVIGLPGDRIEYKNDTLFINGISYDEPYLEQAKHEVTDGLLTNSFTLQETPVQSDIVPEGHLFVMGDNRRFSKDSRHIGAIPIEKVVGTTNFVFYPIKKIQLIDSN
ncbi:signal peptidase I [Ureibacillus chungkukjangi]|uniref:signal peptidase I n=1 Tax=Ureibacillus chungkukjangi TaxID=1202712 RepID=UPI0038516671